MTFGQLEVLCRHAIKRENEKIKHNAAVHGIDIGKKIETIGGTEEYNGDPDSVKSMSDEGRESMTQRLMKQHMSIGKKVGLNG